ncbi:MAG: tetratricopeptide repeat protein, partial [Xanthomonadales bacterium]|nr:tetratricopeptide repeat protein [Xanthomonadales bacterium]
MASSFSRLRELFERCLEVPEGERPQWFETHVPDTGERIELELMLAADCHATGFLRDDVAAHLDRIAAHAGDDEVPPEALLGRRYGTFELRRLIGRGGQGTVYLAERVGGDFAQTVAVKLLHRGIHDAGELRRFRRERAILARFEHAGVARLIDGGVSADGIPYLAMEYVDGEPIDRWCEHNAPSVEARLRLFLDLCSVVAAAQRALIVHRDLKPSNVLVGSGGTIKVLDFGIAHLLDDGDDEAATRPQMLTPGYGAPEQVHGGAVTLATDVYALGVLLRLLLTGIAPAESPSAQPVALPAQLPVELRWILAKACASAPGLRYRDAATLADDIRRLLACQPVSAHPPSRTYLLRKFAQRHRGGILVTAALVAGVLASLALSLWQAGIAREQARRAQATRDFVVGLFETANEDLPADARPTPDVLVRAAAKRLAIDTSLAPASRADFLATLGEVAKNGNDYAAALDFYDQALQALGSTVAHDAPARLAIEIKRAWALGALDRGDAAADVLRPHLARLRANADDLTVEALWAYADAREAAGHGDEAPALLGEARDLALRLHGADAVESLRIAFAHSRALTQVGELVAAKAELTDALARWQRLAVPVQQDYAVALGNLALLQRRLGDYTQAIATTTEALALSRRIHPRPHEDTAALLQVLGQLHAERGETAQASSLLQEAATMLESLLPPGHALRIGVAGSLGLLAFERHEYAQSVRLLEQSIEACRSSAAPSSRCATNEQWLSTSLLRLGRLDEARAANAHALARRAQLQGTTNPDYAIMLRGRADVRLAEGNPAAALADYDAALALIAQAGIDASLERASALGGRAESLLALDRPGEALETLDTAQRITTSLAPANAGRLLRLLAARARG